MAPRPSEHRGSTALGGAPESRARPAFGEPASAPWLRAVPGSPAATTPIRRRPRFPDAVIDAGAGAAYRLLGRLAPDPLLRRLGIATPRRRSDFYTLERIVRTMPAFPGAILECGTHHGGTLLGVAHVLRSRGISTRIYGLDSFEGFPEPTLEDAREDGTMHPWVRKGFLNEASYDELLARVRRMGLADRVMLIKGFFKDTLSRLEAERFSVVHVDCDLYDSYLTCLEFAYPRMLPGGYIVLDDYGSPVYVGARRAVDEFFAGRPERIQFFPDAAGWRYFVFMGGGIAPGARQATTIEWPVEQRAA